MQPPQNTQPQQSQSGPGGNPPARGNSMAIQPAPQGGPHAAPSGGQQQQQNNAPRGGDGRRSDDHGRPNNN